MKKLYLLLTLTATLAVASIVYYTPDEKPIQRLRELKCPGNRGISNLCVSRDTCLLAAGCWDESVRVWDIRSGSLVASLEGFGGDGAAVAIRDDGQTLAFSASSKVEVRHLDRPQNAGLRLLGHSASVRALSFSRNGILASAGLDNTIMLWDSTTGKRIAKLEGHSDGVQTIAFSADGSLLVSGGDDNSVRVWDVRSAKCMLTLGHTRPITSVAFLGDSSILASGSVDHSIRLWDVSTGKLIKVLKGHSISVTRLACSRDGKMLASADAGAIVILWDPSSGMELTSFSAHGAVITGLALCDEEGILASASSGSSFDDRNVDGEVRLWRIQQWKQRIP
jgi:WD40 repeat protein